MEQKANNLEDNSSRKMEINFPLSFSFDVSLKRVKQTTTNPSSTNGNAKWLADKGHELN